MDGTIHRWFLDPLVGRGYPLDMVDHFRREMNFVKLGDLARIATPVDFLGVNYYSRNIVRAESISETENAARTVFRGDEITEMDWEVYPQGLYILLERLHREYAFPAILITENGAAYPDEIGGDGRVDDPLRRSYIQRHLEMAGKAILAGVPVKGYFVWSLLDNFEWSHGYSKRFGIVYVDFQTQRRIPKSSAQWYQQVIHDNAIN
jgi:beta-glucosidase